MTRFILRRLAILPLALLVAHFAGFTYVYFSGGRTARQAGEEVIPLIPAYSAHINEIINLDFGLIPGSEETVISRVLSSTANSLGLLGIALTLSILIGLTLGLRAARNDPPSVTRWLAPISTLGLAMPSFFLGSLFIAGSIFYLILGGPEAELPFPLQGFGWDLHLVLPILALMIRPTVQIAQVTAELLSTEFGKQYVIASRSLGYSWQNIRRRFALRNVLAPVALNITASFRLLIGELIIVETLFVWPGLGRLLYIILVGNRFSMGYVVMPSAYLANNPSLAAATIAVLAALFLFADFITAVLIRVFDPRLLNAEEGR